MNPYLPFTYCALLLLSTLSCASDSQGYQRAIQQVELPAAVYNELRGGEIILRKGDGFLSGQLIQILNEEIPLSHCGMIIKGDTSVFVIHAISDDYKGRDGVQPTTLTNFVNKSIDSSLIIVRPKFNDSTLIAMQNEAKRYVHLNKLFDYKFNLSDTTEIYCTELLKYIFEATVEEDIFPLRKLPNGLDNLYFVDFFNETYFELVYSMKPLPKIMANPPLASSPVQ
jgi:hypothetical protein